MKGSADGDNCVKGCCCLVVGYCIADINGSAECDNFDPSCCCVVGGLSTNSVAVADKFDADLPLTLIFFSGEVGISIAYFHRLT